jgi:hypothetical protein
MATCDALIASMDSKFAYGLWRPHHAIRLADTDGNPDTEADPGWTALILAPRFPEYISNHASLTGAFMHTLARLLSAYPGLQVIDVSNPANPQRVGGYYTGGEAYGVVISGIYAYLADDTNGLQVIDISNPANPQRVGGYDTSGRALSVVLSGNFAYVADDWAGLQVVDVSNPANPRRVGGMGFLVPLMLLWLATR